MKKKAFILIFGLLLPIIGSSQSSGNEDGAPLVQFKFNGNTSNSSGVSKFDSNLSFVEGLEGQALRISSDEPSKNFVLNNSDLPFNVKEDFSVQFWVRTLMGPEKSAVILSQKEFKDKSLASQKKAGWVFYMVDGTWAWNIGSEKRRVTYERDNGKYMPLNDGEWHQLTMTYNSELSEIRLYYDGNNRAIYKVGDSGKFNFTSSSPLVVGSKKLMVNQPEILPEIKKGAKDLQALVDEFNSMSLPAVRSEEFLDLIVDAEALFDQKVNEMKALKDSNNAEIQNILETSAMSQVEKLRKELMQNPYTVHQVRDFMKTAPLLQIYSLKEGEVIIDPVTAETFTKKVKLSQSEFSMDNLAIWDRTLSQEEVLNSYREYFQPEVPILEETRNLIVVADWNIHHGGKHYTIEKDGWDSRTRIAEILQDQKADVIMMQETYSSGDFIAAELGYYFATTIDWDYLNQGSNISILSRYPINEIYVPEDASFMNIGAKIAISKTQEIYVMSNWYGMNKFPEVFDFHKSRFEQSNNIPVFFGGDFNAVPHTDGGNSPASIKLIKNGFIDAYRNLYPDVQKYAGPTHSGGERIDQLYYKGKGLENNSTNVISSWPTGFPSDHSLIISEFQISRNTSERNK